MSIQHRLHIYGASGSGTTTLGVALSESLNILHLDTDNFYWKKSDIPYTVKHTPEERIHNIKNTISNKQAWVLSGSLCSWGGPLTNLFTHTIFLYINPVIRLRRLRERERQCYGGRIKESGDMYEKHTDFMEWAARYDTASPPTRSLKMHRAWGNSLECPAIELDSRQPVEELVQHVIKKIQA